MKYYSGIIGKEWDIEIGKVS